MTGQLLVMALAGVLLGLCGGYGWGRWNGNRALDATWDDGYERGQADEWERSADENYGQALPHVAAAAPDHREAVQVDAWRPDQDARALTGSGSGEAHTPSAAERALMLAELAPEALEGSAALQLDEGSQRDVPEPASAGIATRELSGLGHPSPYAGSLTPAQRRRDKHKQRGQYAPGDLPDPPTDVGAWWQEELRTLLEDGQSGWYSRNLAGVT